MDFFDRVKELVKQDTQLTLRAFIGSIGLNYETYYSGKRRENLPRADDALKIAQSLGVSVEYLVTGEDPARPDNAQTIADLKEYTHRIKEKLDTLK